MARKKVALVSTFAPPHSDDANEELQKQFAKVLDLANRRGIESTIWREALASIAKGRVTFTPMPSVTKSWRMRGEATLGPLFSKTIVALGGTSPPRLNQLDRVGGLLPRAA